jgi:hypothetical protein
MDDFLKNSRGIVLFHQALLKEENTEILRSYQEVSNLLFEISLTEKKEKIRRIILSYLETYNQTFNFEHELQNKINKVMKKEEEDVTIQIDLIKEIKKNQRMNIVDPFLRFESDLMILYYEIEKQIKEKAKPENIIKKTDWVINNFDYFIESIIPKKEPILLSINIIISLKNMMEKKKKKKNELDFKNLADSKGFFNIKQKIIVSFLIT